MELKRREELLAHTLVAAENTADVREHAKRQAELIVAEAHQEARLIDTGIQGEHTRLGVEIRRMEALLRAALGIVEDGSKALPAEVEPEAEKEPATEARTEARRAVAAPA